MVASAIPIFRGSEPPVRAGGPASILKAIAVLGALEGQTALSLVELTERVSMPKSTVFRLLASLIEEGLIERHEEGYQLGRRVHRLGQNALGGQPALLLDAGLPLMTELQRETGLIINLAWLQGVDVAYLATLRTRESPGTPATIRSTLPAHCTALGKALLAFSPWEEWSPHMPSVLRPMTARSLTSHRQLLENLKRVRDEGLALETQEASPHLSCLAVPVLRQGTAVAALSVSSRPGGFDPIKLRGALKRAALHIARSLAEN